jgi:predicted nuclease with TOPRIM domain
MTLEDRDDIKRYFDVVAEDLRSEIRAVAEGVAMNTERLDRLDGRLDRLEAKGDRLEANVDRLDGEFRAFREETRENFATLRAEFGARLQTVEGKMAS